MTQHPDLVGGTGRLDTVLMTVAQEKILSKTGAEGVYACLIPEKDTVVVVKAEDGAARASQAVLYTAAGETCRLADKEKRCSTPSAPSPCPPLKNWRGIEVGAIKVQDQL